MALTSGEAERARPIASANVRGVWAAETVATNAINPAITMLNGA
jgi:hypothetical protein